jgi:hypothetical protein
MFKIYEIKILKKTFSLFKNNISSMFIPVLIDLGGLFFFLLIHNLFYTKIIEYLSLILLKLSEDSNSFFSMLLFQKDLGLLLNNYPEIGLALKNLIFLSFLMGFILYIIYSIFTGFSLFYCAGFIKKKEIDLTDLLKKYFKINLFWTFLLVLGWIFSSLVDLNVVVMQNIDTGYSGSVVSGFVTFFFFVVIYFLWISYGLIFKYNFVETIKNIFNIKLLTHLKLILVFCGFVFLAFLIDYIIGFFSSLILILGLVFLFPLHIFFRMYIIKYFQNNQ